MPVGDLEWLDGIVTINANGFPVFKRMPTVAELKQIVPTDPEGMAVLHRLQAITGFESAEGIRQAQVQYLTRFNITPSNPLYAQQLQNLNESVNSNRVIVATARRNSERMQTATMLEGKDKQCIYINEGEDPCSSCDYLAGETGPYSYFVENNLRPGDQCLGGDNCLCVLIPNG
jgi:hypothetical protein